MKAWMTKALELLKASLEPPKHELNELDWKAALSPDKKRLTEHLSAFANQPGGGYLVFGVDSAGTPSDVDEKTVDTTVNQLANLGRAIPRTRACGRRLHNQPRRNFGGAEAGGFSRPEPQGRARGGL